MFSLLTPQACCFAVTLRFESHWESMFKCGVRQRQAASFLGGHPSPRHHLLDSWPFFPHCPAGHFGHQPSLCEGLSGACFHLLGSACVGTYHGNPCSPGSGQFGDLAGQVLPSPSSCLVHLFGLLPFHPIFTPRMLNFSLLLS